MRGQGRGGVNLTDVTDLAKPVRLATNAGDRGDAADASSGFPPSDVNEIHSSWA